MATKLKKILVPVDGSKNSLRGLDEAFLLAKQSGAEVTGFYVFHLPLAAGIKYTSSMKESAQKKAANAIRPAIQRANKAGVIFKYKTGGGNTGSEIVNLANKGNYDMVIIGARGLGATKEAFLGSVSNHVMHKARVPVLVVK